MAANYRITSVVEFREQATMPKEQSEKPFFDVFVEEVGKDDRLYCEALLNRIFSIKYAQLPEFFTHHCNLLSDPVKWLNKLEKLISENEQLFTSSSNHGRMMKCYTIIESKRKEIEQTGYKHTAAKLPMQYVNAESDDRYFSFREVKTKVDAMLGYTDKIMFLTKEKFDYEQASIDFINPKLPDYSEQCQKEIDQIQHLNRLTNEFSIEETQMKNGEMPFSKLKINCNINQLVDVFYQLTRELHVGEKPMIDGNPKDVVAIIVNSFVDKEGRGLSPDTVRTMLTPSKADKRPKTHKRIDINKRP